MRLRVEGSCCWIAHARKRFKVSIYLLVIIGLNKSLINTPFQGFKTFLSHQGEHNVPSKLFRSLSKTECHLLPVLKLGSCGWLAGLGLLLVLIITAVFKKKKEKKSLTEKNDEERPIVDQTS